MGRHPRRRARHPGRARVCRRVAGADIATASRINEALAELPVGKVLDGELACIQPLAHGRVRCRLDGACALMLAGAPHRPDANGLTVALIVFDALAVAGEDLRRAPWSERRARLQELLGDADGAVRLTPVLELTPRFTPRWSPTAERARCPSAHRALPLGQAQQRVGQS